MAPLGAPALKPRVKITASRSEGGTPPTPTHVRASSATRTRAYPPVSDPRPVLFGIHSLAWPIISYTTVLGKGHTPKPGQILPSRWEFPTALGPLTWAFMISDGTWFHGLVVAACAMFVPCLFTGLDGWGGWGAWWGLFGQAAGPVGMDLRTESVSPGI